MHRDVSRRRFLNLTATVGVAALASTASAADAPAKGMKIVAVSGSRRKGKTTATALNVCLEAAKAVAPAEIEVELIELADCKVFPPFAEGPRDDFAPLLEKVVDPRVAGIILGSPSYFGDMSSHIKAFLERWQDFRKDFRLSNRVGGALAVGGARNGGQENVLRSLQLAMFGQEMILVGDGRPTAHYGATLWNNAKDDIQQDEFGISTAKNLGRRVAEVARLVRK